MKNFLKISLLILVCGCTSAPKIDTQHQTFYDISGYFTSEAKRLTERKASVQKTVRKNNETEQKILSNIDWLKELDLFISSDINKPAWLRSYIETRSDSIIRYSPIDSNLKIKSIIIKELNGDIQSVYIQKYTKNFLYTSSEELFYYPDSIYKMTRVQKVIWLGETTYAIEGKILK